MNTTELQQQLFTAIKTKIPAHLSAPEEIAKLLDVSVDSAYRRMRSEKELSLNESQTLCTHYKISLDQLMHLQTGSFLFEGTLLDKKTYHYNDYMNTMMHTLAYFNSFNEKDYYYLCKDLPVFYNFHSRAFSAFRYFFRVRSILDMPGFKNKKLSLDEFPDSIHEVCKKCLALYNQIDSCEIWTMESLNSTLRQVQYYVDQKIFISDKEALLVYEAVEKFLVHFEEMVSLGYKFNADDPDKKPLGKLNVYLNEYSILDNSMIIKLDNKKMAVLPHSTIDYVITRDHAFCENFYANVQNLIRKSTLISQVSEKERSRFFRLIREKVSGRKLALKL